MKGFSLIEIIVVIALLSILALVGVETITTFQKNTLLDITTNEFVATLRQARNSSIVGEFGEALKDKKTGEFTSEGLPKYGVKVDSASYTLIQNYQLRTDASLREVNLESFAIENSLQIVPTGQVTFARITGITLPVTYIVQKKDGSEKREVQINDQGVVLEK